MKKKKKKGEHTGSQPVRRSPSHTAPEQSISILLQSWEMGTLTLDTFQGAEA